MITLKFQDMIIIFDLKAFVYDELNRIFPYIVAPSFYLFQHKDCVVILMIFFVMPVAIPVKIIHY